MRSTEFITEGKNHPIICVDVQPAYDNDLAPDIVNFVANQIGPVLMYVNAEQTAMTEDSTREIIGYWERLANGASLDDEEYGYDAETEEYFEPESIIDWQRFSIVDKGYGYFRSWMDYGINDAIIIKTIRAMYQAKVTDSRQLFGGDSHPNYEENMQKFMGYSYDPLVLDDALHVEWASIAQLKKFSGAYLVGGGRNECLREVELLMNAFNIKYKRIDSLIYG